MANNPGAYVGAVGIGVSDLKRSGDFYERVLGMKVLQTFKLPHMDEIVLGHEGRTAVVLMHWTDGSERNYRDVPVKLVFYLTDPTGELVLVKIVAANESSFSEENPNIGTMWASRMNLTLDEV